MIEMKITEIHITIVEHPKLKAFASITLDDQFAIHGLKIIQGAQGLFIAMPARKTRSGEFQDIAHPINAETRQFVEKQVLEKYQEAARHQQPSHSDPVTT